MSGSMVSAMCQSVKEVDLYLMHCTREWMARPIWSWWKRFRLFSIIDDGMSMNGHCSLKHKTPLVQNQFYNTLAHPLQMSRFGTSKFIV